MSQITEKLNTQLKVEKEALNFYNSFIEKTDDFKVKDRIKSIRDDEIEHIKFIEAMASIIEGYKEKIKILKPAAKGISLNGFISKFNSLFIISAIDDYPQAVIEVMKELKMDCIYLSFNKLPKYTKRLLAEHEVDIKRIKFVSCIKFSGEGLAANPESLTEVSSLLEKLMQKAKGRFFVLVDTISAFSVYHSEEAILRFISLIHSKLEKYDSGIIWVAIKDESEKELYDKISALCDKFIRI